MIESPRERYNLITTETWDQTVQKYPNQKKAICKFKESLVFDPYINSTRLEGQFKGKRRKHIGLKFVAIYIICEECRLLEPNISTNNCMFCNQINPNCVILLVFKPRENAYRKL
jgi:hypothetical protein